MCSFHIKYVWDWTVPDVVIVVTAHLLKGVNNVIHFRSCQHVDHEYNCSSPEQKPSCYFVDLLLRMKYMYSILIVTPGRVGEARAPQNFTLKTLLIFIHAAQIVAPQCILHSAPPKWNCFLCL